MTNQAWLEFVMAQGLTGVVETITYQKHEVRLRVQVTSNAEVMAINALVSIDAATAAPFDLIGHTIGEMRHQMARACKGEV